VAAVVPATQALGRAVTSQAYRLTWPDIDRLVAALATRRPVGIEQVYGVPRNGTVVAALLRGVLPDLALAETPDGAGTWVVDDLVDSGTTLGRFNGQPVDAMIRKPWSPTHLAPHAVELDAWVVFPWETEHAPEDAVVRLLTWLGEDPQREGLRDTPARVLRALREMTTGYDDDPVEILTRQFELGYDELVIVRAIPFWSLCEHHLLPFHGEATVGYLPGPRVVGLSKVVRLVECYARRLQVQERLTVEIAEALMTHLQARGAGVILRARHGCMETRGVRAAAETVTSAMLGVFRDEAKARAELLALTRA
jgi:GTP cyclohydrolase I